MVDLLQVVIAAPRLHGRLPGWLDRLDPATLGYGAIALLVLAWGGSVVFLKF